MTLISPETRQIILNAICLRHSLSPSSVFVFSSIFFSIFTLLFRFHFLDFSFIENKMFCVKFILADSIWQLFSARANNMMKRATKLHQKSEISKWWNELERRESRTFSRLYLA